MRSILLIGSLAFATVAFAQTLVPIPSNFAGTGGEITNYKASVIGKHCIATYNYKNGLTGFVFLNKSTWDAVPETGGTKCTNGTWVASGANGSDSGRQRDIFIKGGKAYSIR